MKSTSTRASSGTSRPRASASEALPSPAGLSRALLVSLLLVVGLAAQAASAPELRGGVFEPPRAAPDFSLKGTNGAEFKLSSYRGKVVALAFGYTHCPSVCPTTLAFLAEARRKLAAAGADFQVVYVTVDPERDTAQQLKGFLASFDPTFVGATGTPQQLAGVRKDYGITVSDKIFVETLPKSSYFLDHSSFIYLIDRGGRIREMMPYGVSADDMEHDVKMLLAK
ncbi:MAG TPA: SCO family protein [Casimicrobiaceae bacterium]|nr:SCO family protein [Casimicrobiaceae bacterium]